MRRGRPPLNILRAGCPFAFALGLAIAFALAGCDEGQVGGLPDGSSRDAGTDTLSLDAPMPDAASSDTSTRPDGTMPQDVLATDSADVSRIDAADVPADVPRVPCDPIPGVTYSTLTISGPPTDRPAAMHGDINLMLRRWESVPGTRGLVHYDGPTDAIAPRLNTVFTDDRIPVFTDILHVQNWDWGCNCASGWQTTPFPVQLVSFATRPGEVIETPDSGYDIGGGNDVMVLYATYDTLTLKYTREDNVVRGYTVHLAGVCPEPRLLALYQSSNASGRGSLPALRGNQPLGRARAGSIHVAIRDTGAWMDPRSDKDWWPMR